MALFELRQPGIRLVGVHMLSGRPKGFPSLERVLPERLSLFFALNVLRDGFAHQPVRRTLACAGQVLDTFLDVFVDLDRHRANNSTFSHGYLTRVLQSNTLPYTEAKGALPTAGAAILTQDGEHA